MLPTIVFPRKTQSCCRYPVCCLLLYFLQRPNPAAGILYVAYYCISYKDPILLQVSCPVWLMLFSRLSCTVLPTIVFPRKTQSCTVLPTIVFPRQTQSCCRYPVQCGLLLYFLERPIPAAGILYSVAYFCIS